MARTRASTKGATRRQARPRQGKPVTAKTTVRARGPGGRFLSKVEQARLAALEARRERDRARRAEQKRAEEKRLAALEARRERDRARRAEAKRAREEAERLARERLEQKRARDRERKRAKREAEKKQREALERRRERDRARRAEKKRVREEAEREAKRAREEAEQKRLAELEKKRRRAEAAKEGWRKRKLQEAEKERQKQAREEEKIRRKLEEEAEKLRRQKVDASAGLEALFRHPKWFDASWVAFADGTIEGVIVVVAGDASIAHASLADLETDVSEVIRREKVWCQVGVTFEVRGIEEHDEDRYESFRGTDMIWTYPRRGKDVASVFMAMSAPTGVLANIIAKDYKPLTFLVRVVSGIKPSES